MCAFDALAVGLSVGVAAVSAYAFYETGKLYNKRKQAKKEGAGAAV